MKIPANGGIGRQVGVDVSARTSDVLHLWRTSRSHPGRISPLTEGPPRRPGHKRSQAPTPRYDAIGIGVSAAWECPFRSRQRRVAASGVLTGVLGEPDPYECPAQLLAAPRGVGGQGRVRPGASGVREMGDLDHRGILGRAANGMACSERPQAERVLDSVPALGWAPSEARPSRNSGLASRAGS
jgi:hypothetical protein